MYSLRERHGAVWRNINVWLAAVWLRLVFKWLDLILPDFSLVCGTLPTNTDNMVLHFMMSSTFYNADQSVIHLLRNEWTDFHFHFHFCSILLDVHWYYRVVTATFNQTFNQVIRGILRLQEGQSITTTIRLSFPQSSLSSWPLATNKQLFLTGIIRWIWTQW